MNLNYLMDCLKSGQTLEEIITNDLKNMDEEEQLITIKSEEGLFYESLYIVNKDNEKKCFYNGINIELKPREFNVLCILVRENTKSHVLDEHSNVNERQIVARINRAFKKAGFNEKIVMKNRKEKGYRLNKKFLPDFYIQLIE